MEVPHTMRRTLEQYNTVAMRCMDLFERKAQDYGTAWRILRVPSITDQVQIKAQRIRTLQSTGVNMVGEGVGEELVGIVNYSAMALVQLRSGVVERPDLTPEEGLAQVQRSLQEARELMLRKNHDYGEAWRSMRIGSIVDLVLMKLLRIKQIEMNAGETVASEGLDANFLDILNYGIFALILLDEGQKA
jgi:Nucleotide modification associated domain 1